MAAAQPPQAQPVARAYIGLGANLGDLAATLRAALAALAALPGTTLVAVSSPWRTAPVDAFGPDFLNACAALDTTLEPLALLDALQAIETAHGRQRPYRNAPRTLDLDVLAYADLQLHTERLTLPHPRVFERAFVVRPLLEIVPAGGPFAAALQRALPGLSAQLLTRQDRADWPR
ncbi:MAG: 2-amino-4-hydroxy-6-hydroxymethyldihydropteridine diphosphokinase [Pelomonas sp.]|nr:2-amino-4-hydroxy-6-hydroxymethyldihydropteridine diphosphokinase [Roseateles sp.]